MDKMYVSFCVDCSREMSEEAIDTVNRIVRTFMQAALANPKLDKMIEYAFSGCMKYENQKFQRPEMLKPTAGWIGIRVKRIQVSVDSEKKLYYPVFQTADTSRNLCQTVKAAHKALSKKIRDARKSGDSVYTGFLVVVADGCGGVEHIDSNEKKVSALLKMHCTGAEAEKCHIVPILIDLHATKANNCLVHLAADFPGGYVRLGPGGRADEYLRRCFSEVLGTANKSVTTTYRREQVNSEVVSQLKKLKAI